VDDLFCTVSASHSSKTGPRLPFNGGNAGLELVEARHLRDTGNRCVEGLRDVAELPCRVSGTTTTAGRYAGRVVTDLISLAGTALCAPAATETTQNESRAATRAPEHAIVRVRVPETCEELVGTCRF
jgi:hypothetical protein